MLPWQDRRLVPWKVCTGDYTQKIPKGNLSQLSTTQIAVSQLSLYFSKATYRATTAEVIVQI